MSLRRRGSSSPSTTPCSGQHEGKQEIHAFFVDFLAGLPEGALDRFELRSRQVEGSIGYITWSVGSEIPLGTDTFVVDNGKIVSQTFAMFAHPSQ
jgi:hypothetical protein